MDGGPVRLREALGDFARLVGKALLGGTGVAVVLAMAILALSAPSMAAPLEDAKAEGRSAPATRPGSAAPTPQAGLPAPGVGALWARTDDPATVHVVLGLLALGAAGVVAAVGRRA